MATQPAPAQAAPAAPKAIDPAEVRNVVAAQPTVAGSVACLLQAVVGVISQCLRDADPQGLQRFADNLNADTKAWSDAVLANTGDAAQTATTYLAVPGHLQEVFTKHAAAQAAAAKAH